MELRWNNVTVAIQRQTLIENVSLKINKGEFVSILGKNGSGKSTLIRALHENIATSGKVLYLEREMNSFSLKELARKFAYMFQFQEKIENLTVYDFVAYGRRPYQGLFRSISEEDEQIISETLEVTNLKSYQTRMLSTLSGGERQRAALALCIVQQPEILILDEPTNHLDIQFQFALLKIIKQLNINKKVTIICILHDINQAAKFSTRLIFLKDGKIYKDGTVEACVNEKDIHEVFGVEVEVHKKMDRVHVDYIV